MGKGSQCVPAVSSGAPFGCGTVSVSVMTRADCARNAGQQESVGCMGHLAHNGLPILGCHGDGGEGALAQSFLSLHCSCCFQQTSHSSAAAAVGDGVDVVAVVSLETSPAGSQALKWTQQTLHFQLQLMTWHCGYV